MYQTKLTKEQLAYNIAYHLEKETDKSAYEVIIGTLTTYEESLKNSSKTFDNRE